MAVFNSVVRIIPFLPTKPMSMPPRWHQYTACGNICHNNRKEAGLGGDVFAVKALVICEWDSSEISCLSEICIFIGAVMGAARSDLQ